MGVRATHTYPTRSYRLSPEAVELIKAFAAWKGVPQAMWLESVLARVSVPAEALNNVGEAESRLRVAHQAFQDHRNVNDTHP